MKTYITDFIPWGKTYCFSMDKHDCYYRNKGICSLRHYKIPCEYIKGIAYNSKLFCPNLATSLLQNGFFQAADDVKIHKKECGHYEISQGQHRVCVCARLQMPMKVLYQEDTDKCRICSVCEYNLKKKFCYKLLLEKDFLLNL